MPSEWAGRRVTVMGLGTRGGGVGVARYLAQSGAIVTVTDLREAASLDDQMAELADLDIRFVLGKHEASDFTVTDAVVRNPGVRRDNPFLATAHAAGVPVEMEMALFLRACPAAVIGVTGTKGKTSTTALCAEMLRQWRPDTVAAGNMGISAVAALPMIANDTPVVLELSSWQLEGMDERAIGPQIAVITNISEDHLDTYRDFAEYAETKRSIARHLTGDDFIVLNADDVEVARTAETTMARPVWFGAGELLGPGVRVIDSSLESTIPGALFEIAIPDHPGLRGPHQRLNAAAAAASAAVRGAPIAAIEAGLHAYSGIPNRMEVVAEIDGVLFINDTAATAPAAAIASLRAFAGRPIHLISGGADKKLPVEPLAQEIATRAATITLFDGTATPALRDSIAAMGREDAGIVVTSMAAAIENATRAAVQGDVVLLSPGCASFGVFRDEFDRGSQFREQVLSRVPTGVRT